MTAADHHVQDALELYVPARLQWLAERAGAAHQMSAADQYRQLREQLAANGHTLKSLFGDPNHKTYRDQARAAAQYLFAGLRELYPDATFSFAPIGTEGRVAQIKGDMEVEIRSAAGTDVRWVSLKNYKRGVARIQVMSGTFQSFALSFLLPSAGIGSWCNPVDGTTRRSDGSAGWVAWRNKAVVDAGFPQALPVLEDLDRLHADMKATLLGGEFRIYDAERISAVQREVGAAGAVALTQLVACLPNDVVRDRILKATGLAGDEDLVAFGRGEIVDTLTDPAFAGFLRRLRSAQLTACRSGQSLMFAFVDANGEQVLTVDVPCTINTNGAWFRDGDPYEGTRFHAKERLDLEWGQLRPKKSRELATSINTYLALGATGLPRQLPSR